MTFPMPSAVLSAVLVLCAASACRRAREAPAPVVAPTIAIPETSSPSADADARARAAREAADRETRAREERERERIRAILVAPIQFGFDRSDLTAQARSTLDAKLQVLRADPSVRIRVEGHADERGSSEYNLALGMRRAAAARRYLIQRDIAPARIEITSLGEERPICETAEEQCWEMNRRDEFVVLP